MVTFEMFAREMRNHDCFDKMMGSNVRAITSMISEGNRVHVDHISSLVSILRTFLTYGTDMDPSSHKLFGGGFPRGRGSGGSRSNSGQSGSGSSPSVSESDSISVSQTETETERESDSLSQRKNGADQFDSTARFRCVVQQCLTTIARADIKLFHEHWMPFLPSDPQEALNNRPFSGPNLLTVALYDPSSKVRAGAVCALGVMLEDSPLSKLAGHITQNQRTPRGTPTKKAKTMSRFAGRAAGFSSLSTRYANIIYGIHSGLLHALQNEKHMSTRIQVTKSINVLVSNIPYEKVGPDLIMPLAKYAVEESRAATGNFKYALLALISSIFGTSVSHSQLEVLLPPPEARAEVSVIKQMLREAKSRQKDWPYPDARTIISKLARGYRQSLEKWWTYGLRDLMVDGGLNSEDPTVVLETLKIVENWLVPAPFDYNDAELIKNKDLVRCATSGFANLEGAGEILGKCLPKLMERFTGEFQHASPVRVRVVQILSVFRIWQWRTLDSVTRKELLKMVLDALNDDVESVRTAACRAVGVLGTFHLEETEFYQKSCIFLVRILCNEQASITVKVRAAWALANMCDLRVNVHHQHPNEPPTEIIPDYEDTTRPPLAKLLHRRTVNVVIDTCFKMTNENPKVVANVIRAIGNIGLWLEICSDTEDFDVNHQETVWCSICDVLNKEIQRNDSKQKAKWNACYATGNVLSNPQMPSIRSGPAKAATLQLYKSLLSALEKSTNFKVRINAVVALTAPPTRQHYGALFGTLWINLIRQLQNVGKNRVMKFVEYTYQQRLEHKLVAGIFKMSTLCSKADIRNIQVVQLLSANIVWIADLIEKEYTNLSTLEKKRHYAKLDAAAGKKPQEKKKKKQELEIPLDQLRSARLTLIELMSQFPKDFVTPEALKTFTEKTSIVEEPLM